MSKSIVKLIGIQIAERRKERKITQEELAELVKVSTETISRLERGVSVPSLKTLEKKKTALYRIFLCWLRLKKKKKRKILS